MRSAIIGLGVIGKVHYNVLKELEKDVVAVCDIDENVINDLQGVEKYTDYKKMIDEVKPDVVHICTPHYLHADMCIYALERDINVLCEKPLCITGDDLDRVLLAEKNSKAQLGVVLQNRYNPSNVFVKEFLKDKKVLNAYATCIWSRDKKYYEQAEWRGKKSTEGGGLLINQALHTLDLLQWYCGEPKEVVASVSNLTLKGVIEVEDTASVLYYGDTDFSVYATNGSTYNYDPEIVILTDKGRVEVEANCVVVDGQSKLFTHDERVYGKPCYGTGHGLLIDRFYNCLSSGEKFEIDGKEGSKVVKMILGAYASQGNKVEI